MTATQPVRVICAGVGAQGRDHRIPALLTLAESHGVEIPAVVDVNVEGAQEYVNRFSNPNFLAWLHGRGYPVSDQTARRFAQARVYRGIQHALDGVQSEAVMSVVPNPWKKEVAIASLEAGRDVFSDKPTAPSPEDAEEISRFARRRGRVFKVGYHLPDMAAPIRELLVREAIKVAELQIDWSRANGIPDAPHFWDDPRTGGVTKDLGGHLAALIEDLTGERPIRVLWARVSNDRGRRRFGHAFRADDTIEALLELASGVIVWLRSSWDTGRLPGEQIKVDAYGVNGEQLEGRLIPQKGIDHDPNPLAYAPVLRREGHPVPFVIGDGPPVYTRCMIRGAEDFIRLCRGGDLTDPDPVTIERIVHGVLTAAATGDPVSLR